ncbi:DUF2103 domain-containing protein [Natronobacterium gregoryi]|uniref:Metal-binding protein n=2 Tax=Natronobacterium gregoryi TaxID=44930 RepID=L0AE12_NATGS|nr:DUF2103 domain-containing protein [Natronobacterium gregoryi]AFZ72081.1 putative metal-binding protein [Natronobacterium gregoryi SP2]ELY62745.1 hypothetical protein C490_17057 [Natronobacterium gregoryi SP2]PLK20055.1 metal-binding protein [Natronobacterium gregoryi SP2]SFJ44331.1 hypothetical protein SAMN05443661_1308 [Natronobacterium gregoryi]
MECRHCASPLEKPGDFCLVCREANTEAVVLEAGRERATLSMLGPEDLREPVLGQTTITTTPEDGENEPVELRNFAGLIGDEIRRKRPDEVYAGGERLVIRAVREDVHYPFYRVDDDEPVHAVRNRRGNRALEVVETPPAEKIGGSHSTLIGGRTGMRAIQAVAGHPHVKKVIPGPIDAGGKGSQSGLRAKVTRADDGGNVRMLIRNGSSVQENRVVTTARDREMGERIREDLNEVLSEAEFQ